MTGVSRSFYGLVLALVLLLVGFAAPLRAQDAAAPEAAWQAVITGQIEAFRAGDGAAALSFAGAGFRARYTDPNAFVVDIARSGYAPIVASRSHSFGKFDKVSDTIVMQVVRFVGPDQMLYEGLYQLMLEKDGWRVAGVALKKQDGLSV